MELRPIRYEQNKPNMILMNNAFKRQENTLKTWTQYGNMKLHAILSKFHIWHAQNGAMVQHIHTKQYITTICPKQQVDTLQTSKQHAIDNI